MKGFEKETSIWYNEEDETANVYTFNVGLANRLMRLCKSKPNECQLKRVITSDDAPSKEFIVPKSWISVRPPKKMNLSEEELERRRSQLESARAMKT